MYTVEINNEILEIKTPQDVIDFLTPMPEESIYISNVNWNGGYIATYPGICNENGDYIEIHKTMFPKHFIDNCPDAIEIVLAINPDFSG